jgi:hypothetical protein
MKPKESDHLSNSLFKFVSREVRKAKADVRRRRQVRKERIMLWHIPYPSNLWRKVKMLCAVVYCLTVNDD